jgi:Icc-related predicted phosphoesterase
MLPADWTREHNKSVVWLEENLSLRPRNPRVVVTHFSPSRQLVAPEFKTSPSSAAFHTELYWLIEKYAPKLWIYGHDHNTRQDLRIANTRVVCNQWGYKHERMPRETILVEI